MNGILLVDKPTDWTSMDVCAKLRGACHEKHIGHTGTLDPNATGLLIVLVGKATKAAKFAEYDEKEYLCSLRPGLVTDTQDIWGTTLTENSVEISREALEAVLPAFRGEIEQLPPMYSAVKIKGQKLYTIARRGGTVEREPRKINISGLEILGTDGSDWLLSVRCSKGTYIRTLCDDIGKALGCGACMSALRRTSAGKFRVEDAHPLADIVENPEAFLLPTELITGEST